MKTFLLIAYLSCISLGLNAQKQNKMEKKVTFEPPKGFKFKEITNMGHGIVAKLEEIMAKKWIQAMHMKKGALHAELGVPAGKKIPKKKLAKLTQSIGFCV